MNRTMKRVGVPIAGAVLLGTSGFAFMAANTVPVTSAGNGGNGITGYTVSDVHYDLVDDAFAPFVAEQESIQHIYFTLDKPASEVRAYINDKQFGDACSAVAGETNRWKCTPNHAGFGVLVSEAHTLEVVAAQ